MKQRRIVLPDDRDTVPWFHSLGNYHSRAYWSLNESFEQYPGGLAFILLLHFASPSKAGVARLSSV